MITGKIIALTIWTFCQQSDVSAFWFVIAFLPKSNFNFTAAVTICSDFGAQEKKVCHCLPFYQRTDPFQLWCWRRLLIVPRTARRSEQSIIKEVNPEYSLEGLVLKLKYQYFGHLMERANFLEETLMLGKIEGRRRRGWRRIRWLDSIADSIYWREFEQTSGVSGEQGSLGTSVHEVAKNWKWQQLKNTHPSRKKGSVNRLPLDLS